ncbi:hypothetical protein C8J56DRAFT_1113236 [Mycena floridula]|nr:hypothetical protein C8J56DRAFT_1113236 [Mycena floridula]
MSAKPLTRPWFAWFCKFQQKPASFCPHEFRDWVFLTASRLNDGLWWIQNIAIPSRLSEQKAFLLFLTSSGVQRRSDLFHRLVKLLYMALTTLRAHLHQKCSRHHSSPIMDGERMYLREKRFYRALNMREIVFILIGFPTTTSISPPCPRVPQRFGNTSRPRVLCTADPPPPPKVSRRSWLDDSLQPSKAQQLRPALWKKSSYQAWFRFTAFALVDGTVKMISRQYKDGFTYRRRRSQDQAVV